MAFLKTLLISEDWYNIWYLISEDLSRNDQVFYKIQLCGKDLICEIRLHENSLAKISYLNGCHQIFETTKTFQGKKGFSEKFQNQ